MRCIAIGSLIFLALGLTACGSYHGKYGGKYYSDNSKMIPPITVPHGIHSPVGQQIYAIPWKADGKVSPKLSLLPPDPHFIEYMHEKLHRQGAKHILPKPQSSTRG